MQKQFTSCFDSDKPYGYELIIDLDKADVRKFTREALAEFLDTLCIDILNVRPEDRHFWDDVGLTLEQCQTDPKTKGTTVVQFLLTSNVTIHTLDILRKVYINIFVCRDFDANRAINFCKEFFNADLRRTTVVERL